MSASFLNSGVFNKNNDPNRTMTPLGTGWTDICLVSCIVGCVRMYNNCHSVRYDELTRHCTPGSWLYESKDLSMPGAGTIYYSRISSVPCMDFQMYTSGIVHTWVWVSADLLNYTDAKNSCRAKGAHLYTTKDNNKLNILINITKNSSTFWIGLDDIKDENIFRWADDDTELTSDLRHQFFQPGQPDNKNSSEDCVEFNPGYGPLNDKTCDSQIRFICEISCVIDLT